MKSSKSILTNSKAERAVAKRMSTLFVDRSHELKLFGSPPAEELQVNANAVSGRQLVSTTGWRRIMKTSKVLEVIVRTLILFHR